MEQKDILILYKDNSKFYKATGMDAEVLNYLFDYQIIKGKVGFPDNAINKVLDVLDKECISYQVVYTDKNPIIKNYENNKYLKNLEKVKEKKYRKERISVILDKLNDLNIDELNDIISYLDKVN